MIECPQIDVDENSYGHILVSITLSALVIHPYVMYCIVFRSPASMKTYRWYLLWHQVVAFICDLWVSCTN